MTLFGAAFYVLAAFVLITTGLAVTRRDPVHAVLHLILSFLGTALIYALLGAPLLAAFQVILYAGGIMVLFLFVVVMIRGAPKPLGFRAAVGRALVPVAFGLGALLLSAFLVTSDPAHRLPLVSRAASPREFGRFLFERYPVPVEIVSILLFVALVGALYLGRERRNAPEGPP